MENREKVVIRYRKALEQIRDYVGRYEDDMDRCTSMKYIAESILKEVDEENKEK